MVFPLCVAAVNGAGINAKMRNGLISGLFFGQNRAHPRMKGADLVRQMVADRSAIAPGDGANGPLGNPLDPVFGFLMVESITVVTEFFKLRIFTGDGLGCCLQQADLRQECPVKLSSGFKNLGGPAQIGLRHPGRQQKTVIVHGNGRQPMRSFKDERGDFI
ncbi:MAG: hypothetical protein V4713_12655 [Pseudomonadota bacterium]